MHLCRFQLEADEIASILRDDTLKLEAKADVEVPSELVSAEELEALMEQRRPCYVPLAGELFALALCWNMSEIKEVRNRKLLPSACSPCVQPVPRRKNSRTATHTFHACVAIKRIPGGVQHLWFSTDGGVS